MSLTQFAMVEELAFLVKDNLPCKHLVLSMEEALVNFLEDDPSLDGVLELEPMNAYNRLLLHRLADIFGFSHQSVGEGDERHLVLERCSETSIPSILVSDLLWQYDELQPPLTSYQVLKRDKASPVLKAETAAVCFSLEEREADYLAARERIFARYDGETNELMKQKPQSNPVVARRMIAHALGRNINQFNQVVTLKGNKKSGVQSDQVNTQANEQGSTNPTVDSCKETSTLPRKMVNSHAKPKVSTSDSSTSCGAENKVAPRPGDQSSTKPRISWVQKSEAGVQKHDIKEEHIGAAKRMFAHALRFQSAKDGVLSKCSEMKQVQ